MPLYEYACAICDNHFERLRPVSQMDESTNCPDCGSASERQLSVFASLTVSGDGEMAPVGGGRGGGCCGGGCCGGA